MISLNATSRAQSHNVTTGNLAATFQYSRTAAISGVLRIGREGMLRTHAMTRSVVEEVKLQRSAVTVGITDSRVVDGLPRACSYQPVFTIHDPYGLWPGVCVVRTVHAKHPNRNTGSRRKHLASRRHDQLAGWWI